MTFSKKPNPLLCIFQVSMPAFIFPQNVCSSPGVSGISHAASLPSHLCIRSSAQFNRHRSICLPVDNASRWELTINVQNRIHLLPLLARKIISSTFPSSLPWTSQVWTRGVRRNGRVGGIFEREATAFLYASRGLICPLVSSSAIAF